MYNKYISTTLYGRSRKILRDLIPQLINSDVIRRLEDHFFFSLLCVKDDYWTSTKQPLKLSSDLLIKSSVVY